MKLFSSNSGGGKKPSGKRKRTKAPLTRKQKITRTVILSVVGVIALAAVAAAVWWTSSVRAPDPIKKPNDTTIIDPDNGDEPEMDMGDRVADYFTFVVGAVDEDQTRTDALMVVGFDTKTKKINILNIPRDTMSNVSRLGAARKINAAYGTKKGIEQTKKEIQMVVGFKPDYHIIVNFQGIADIVDAIGGVDYEIPFRMYYMDPSQNLSIDFKPGMRHLNGEEVVEFLRWRKNNGGVKTGDPNYTGGDEERIDKQQEFLKYLAAQVLQPSNIPNVQKIANAVFENVKTDLTAGNMIWMGMQAMGTPSENIQMHKLPGYDSYSYAGTDWYGSFFFPNEKETLELVNTYFNPYVNKLTNLDIVSGADKTSHKSSSSGNKTSSGGKDDEKDEPKEPVTPPVSTDPEGGTTGGETGTTPPDGSGMTGGETGTTPPDGGSTGGETTPPPTGGETGGETTPPPADGGGTTGGSTGGEATTPPPAETTPPAQTTPPPAPSVDPEA